MEQEEEEEEIPGDDHSALTGKNSLKDPTERNLESKGWTKPSFEIVSKVSRRVRNKTDIKDPGHRATLPEDAFTSKRIERDEETTSGEHSRRGESTEIVDYRRESEKEAQDRLERSRSNIEILQGNLGTKIHSETAREYKEELLNLRAKSVPKLANTADSSEIAFDRDFLERHNLDKRLKIEENRLLVTDLDRASESDLERVTEEAGWREQRTSSRPSYCNKVSEIEKRWSGDFLGGRLNRESSESSKSSYVEEFGSVSSRESVLEDPGERSIRRAPVIREESRSSIDASGATILEEILENSTVSTVDSDSCLEDRIKSVEQDIEETQRKESTTNREIVSEESNGEEEAFHFPEDSENLKFPSSKDGYASLIKEFAMEAGSTRPKKEEKRKRKLGLRRLLPGFFSPKDSRKEYKKKEPKDRKRHDERHFARYQQNGNYTRSPDTMNLNEDIKRNVKLDNSLNGSMIEERLDEIKRELFSDQGPITSTPDHLAEEDDRNATRNRAGAGRSYTTDSSLSSIAPDDRWNGRTPVFSDLEKYDRRDQQEEELEAEDRRYGRLERKHSLQESGYGNQRCFFQRNHGPSGRTSAPPSERYVLRPRAIRPMDRPLPAIPHSRLQLTGYENYPEEETGYSAERPGVLYENSDENSGLLLKSVSAQVKITRQPITNQTQRAPLVGRPSKYPSPGSSQKSADYADSSCTPNSSQKSEFSPSSSKSGEYYLHSPRNSVSPKNEQPFEGHEEGIYENEDRHRSMRDERIYDETPTSPGRVSSRSPIADSSERSTGKERSPGRHHDEEIPLENEQKAIDSGRHGESSSGGPEITSPRSPSSPGVRQAPSLPSRRSQPNDQILIASPKRELTYEPRRYRTTENSRRCIESPVPMTGSPRRAPGVALLESPTRNPYGNSEFSSSRTMAESTGSGFCERVTRPEPIYGHRTQRNVEGNIESPTKSENRVPVTPTTRREVPGRRDLDDRVAWVQGRASSTPKSPEKRREGTALWENPGPPVVNLLEKARPPLNQESRSQRRPQPPVRSIPDPIRTRKVPEPIYGQRGPTTTGSLSPSKRETRQHLEAFYWQQKALEAHRKSLACPTNSNVTVPGRKIDLPEVREAVYWQQLKKLDEEQQRRIYEENSIIGASCHRGGTCSPTTRTGSPRNPSSAEDQSYWDDKFHRSKTNNAGKAPVSLTNCQKGQNQPVLIVRPQQAIRDGREVLAKPLDPSRDLVRREAQRSKSVSPQFERPDSSAAGQPKTDTCPSLDGDGNDVDGKPVGPPPIFKRGSLVGGDSTDYGTGTGPKRVSFSNQSTSGADPPSGSWPTKRGSAPEPPTRRHRSDDVESTSSRREPRESEAEYDADRPLPPLPPPPPLSPQPRDFGSSTRPGTLRPGPRWNLPAENSGRSEEEWNPDGKGRQSNDIGGSVRGESETISNEVSSGRRSGGGGGGVLGVGGGGGGGSAGGTSGGRSASGGAGRSRDEPRRHTLGGDHQPSLHHQQFNAAQQLHPLHPHHLPPIHGQYGTPPTRHTTMDLEMGTKSRQRKSPLPRGYPPPSAMLFDDDPGIMSEVETSSTGFRRGGKQRSSLPVVRTPSKTLERPLGLVFLQYRNETKRALLPNEITSIDTVKALFVRSFPKQLTMEYLDSPLVKVYIHDSNKDMFYELEDLRSHLRDIRDRSVLRLFESTDGSGGMPTGPLGIPGAGSGLAPHWEDQSYFSEPEFDSEYQHQHIHKSKTAKNSTSGSSGYYSSTLPRGGPLLRAYSPAASSIVAGPNATPTQPKSLATPDRLHGESGYMSSPERGGGVGSAAGRYPTGPYSAGSSYEDPYYSQYSGTVTPVIDEEARIRVEHMERQLANLTGLVQKALTHAPHASPSPRDYLQVTGGRDPYARTADKSVSFEKSVSFSDEPPDMNSPKQHSPQHAERDRHKPTPPPKPAALVAGQYVYRDLALTPEMYNQLRGLQKKAKDLRQEVRNLRRMSQTQAHTVRETIRDTFIAIRAMLLSGGDAAWSAGDTEKIRLSREEDLYKQEMIRLEKDLTELESTVEELRGNVINRKTRVNMSDVENMALILSKSSKTVADLKVRFPSLQEGMKGLLSSEMEKVVREEKFLKEEPERLESALKRCKKLTGTLVTLKRLASVQEQRLPNAASVDAEETPPITPTSAQHSKAAAPVPAERTVLGSASVLGGGTHPHESSAAHQQRPENALDALLDELQTFSRPSSQLGHISSAGHQVVGSSTIASEVGRASCRESAASTVSTAVTTTSSTAIPNSGTNGPTTTVPTTGVSAGSICRPPCISDIGRKGSVDSSTGGPTIAAILGPPGAQIAGVPGTGGTLRRLHSYPSSSDTDTSPPIARLQVSLQEQPSLPGLPQGFPPPGQKPPIPERNAELLQLATARRVPPPPPPRTSSRSPLASPTSPQLPPRNHGCNLQQSGNATLRRPAARGTLPLPGKEAKPPMALPPDVRDATATLDPCSALPAHGYFSSSSSSSPQSSALLSTSNSSSCESVNSQEGLQSKRGRQDQLEQRHQELLRKQKALQEQYARLQQLQRNTAGLTTVPPTPPDLLKKTGSESNLLAKMGLGLSAATSGSLTSLAGQPRVSGPQDPTVENHRPRQEEPAVGRVAAIGTTDVAIPIVSVATTATIATTSTAATTTTTMTNAVATTGTTEANETRSTTTSAVSTTSSVSMTTAASGTTTTTSKIYETDIL